MGEQGLGNKGRQTPTGRQSPGWLDKQQALDSALEQRQAVNACKLRPSVNVDNKMGHYPGTVGRLGGGSDALQALRLFTIKKIAKGARPYCAKASFRH
ncbi:MAG: hypothetical protein ABIQ90_14290 [Polaromonas sp.]